jgi:hypothetical protein
MDNSMPSPSGSVKPSMAFQNAYVWLVFIASLDIMCTWIILWHHGIEVNPLVAKVLSYGAKGLVAYKYLLIAFVIVLCEIVGRRSRRGARVLIGSAIGLTSMPVVLAIAQLWARKHGYFPQ